MSDGYRRLSPYVRDEETLERAVEQTAITQARAAMQEDADRLESVLDDCHGCTNFKFTLSERSSTWQVEFEYDRCGFEGKGDTAAAALAEALVDRDIADYYYAASLEGPSLTQEEMTMRLRDTYRKYFGKWPEHEYRGSYRRRQP